MLINLCVAAGRFLDFAARVAGAIPGAIRKRPGAVVRQFERVAWGGMPLVLAAGMSVGLVTWFQTRRLLVNYGLEDMLPGVLAAAILVETGPILASLLVAGRLGAGLSAELATMQLTEEIDARVLLGSPAIEALVAPRVLACALALPLLTIALDGAALGGGMLAEVSGGSLSVEGFGRRSLDFLRLLDVVPATIKTAVLGGLVGLVACWTGLHSGRSAEDVGRAATRGVVRASLAIFAANAVLVPLIQVAADLLGLAG